MEVGGGDRVPAVDAEKQQLIESFSGITSSSPEEALFFLESHNWQLDSAIQSFYDVDPPPSAAPPAPRRLHDSDDDGDGDAVDEDDDEDYVPPSEAREPSPPVVRSRIANGTGDKSNKRKKKAKVEGKGGISTLADLKRDAEGSGSHRHDSDEEDDDDEDDDGQEYYAGGEKSAMLVRDPSKRKNDVDAIFEQARQRGAKQGSLERSRPSGSRSFAGTGRLLSGESVPAAPQTQQPENIIYDITFWTDGFTVDNGPLRRFDDPANASFLESIKRSECPKELEPSNRKSSVNVNLIRKKDKYPEPVPCQVPFKGIGRTLGSGSTEDLNSQPPNPSTAVSVGTSSSVGLSVDDTLPSTSIQLRLADGTRMVARFNTNHTIGDIRAFIDASRPAATRNYLLQAVGFPPKQLTDDSQTIEQASLLNSVVIQRFQ